MSRRRVSAAEPQVTRFPPLNVAFWPVAPVNTVRGSGGFDATSAVGRAVAEPCAGQFATEGPQLSTICQTCKSIRVSLSEEKLQWGVSLGNTIHFSRYSQDR